jgi:ribosomal protein S6--L-glutamate ligase
VNICLLTDSAQHPVLTDVLARLADRHRVSARDPRTLVHAGQPEVPVAQPDADVYLLKSRSPEALGFAFAAERAGALVVNRPAATALCLDRLALARRLRTGGVPTPRTWGFRTVRALATATPALAAALPWPLVLKSARSRRGDLVQLVHDHAELSALLDQWGDEPIVAQEFAPNDGWDVKMWVIPSHLAVARRPAALGEKSADRSGADVLVGSHQLPDEWASLAGSVGSLLGLELFGVDLVISQGQPVVVDVNAFPGFRSAPGAAEALATFVERVGTAGRASA